MILRQRSASSRSANSFSMKNPFKVEQMVIAKLSGIEAEAILTKVWDNEVQVRTSDNELPWRSMYTVYPAGR